MRVSMEPTMFFDPQMSYREAPCPVCGGSTYPSGYLCLRCREEGEP